MVFLVYLEMKLPVHFISAFIHTIKVISHGKNAPITPAQSSFAHNIYNRITIDTTVTRYWMEERVPLCNAIKILKL